MTQIYTLRLDDERATLERVGGKGAALTEMVRADLPVPDGFHVTTAGYQAFVEGNDLEAAILAALEAADPDRPASLESASRTIEELFLRGRIPPEVAGAIANAYAGLSGAEPVVAVRSSATAEDLPEASFAGQQETYLNIQGPGAVLDAVKRCWASLWTARAIGYRARREIGTAGLSLAVVVQRLVPAEAAGVLFTANPVNGRRDEVVINAAWGLGEAVVGGEVTPDTYLVDKDTGEVIERQIAEKAVMTVRVDGGTQTEPVPEDLRRAPVLDDGRAAELVRLGVQIEDLYGDPRDIEWALADGELAILQARPITALPEPAPRRGEAEPPQEWPMPDPKGKYMRGSIVDLMPDPLTPLYASLFLPAVSEAIGPVLNELIGSRGAPQDFLSNYVVTINDYVYMSGSFTGKELWWMLVRLIPAMPRLLKNAAPHYQEVARPRYAEAVAQWAAPPEERSAAALLDGAQALTEAMARYLTTLQVDTLGIAAGTEMLFTAAYNKLIRREGDPPAPTYLLGEDSLPIQAEKALYDLAAYLQRAPVGELTERWAAGDAPPGIEAEAWREWRERTQAHLDRYGYSIYNLDFAVPIPAHDPTPVLQALVVFVRGEGRDPHARQERFLERRRQAVEAVHARTRGLKRWIFDKTLRFARTHTRLREDSIFEVGLAYPVLREMLLELGQRFAGAGTIVEADDIFWLERDEAERGAAALDRGEAPQNFTKRVEARQARWRAYKRVTPPVQLPKRERILGVSTDALLFASPRNYSLIHYQDNVIVKQAYWPLLNGVMFAVTLYVFR